MPWLNSAPPPTQRFHSSSRRPGTNRSLLVKQRRRLSKKSTAMRRSEQGTIGSIEGDNDVATSCTSGCATRFGVLLSPTGLVTCGQKGPDSALEEAAHDALVK